MWQTDDDELHYGKLENPKTGNQSNYPIFFNTCIGIIIILLKIAFHNVLKKKTMTTLANQDSCPDLYY